MDFRRNALASALSPYLLQHKDDPVWWQEWGSGAVAAARRDNKLLFVSVGYATCHWCHVMARETFRDAPTAAFLNERFVSVKVDREQRPDIDRHLMAFMASLGRPGGWPLNVFLTPELRPVFALTYAPPVPRQGMPAFLDILKGVDEHFRKAAAGIPDFSIPDDPLPAEDESALLRRLERMFDPVSGGFGEGAKFPPHTTLLFLSYYTAARQSPAARSMLEKTLDVMRSGGLCDHLQGGFFRYCVDRDWSIPHFEKTLYDQAMALWVYSLGAAVSGKDAYFDTVRGVWRCLEETFSDGDLYCSGLDADTDHEEGGTYLWTLEELRRELTPQELARFSEAYPVSAAGNMDGRNHLVRSGAGAVRDIEEKLLQIRRKRLQPGVDGKLITSWNCLAGIGLVHAARYGRCPEALARAEALTRSLLARHGLNGRLMHGSCGGVVQGEGFLQDEAALLLLLTFLYEDTGRFAPELRESKDRMRAFARDGQWLESCGGDFPVVPADSFDHPVPSSSGMAELALLRADVLEGGEPAPRPFRPAWAHDMANVAALLANGLFHVLTSPRPLAWPPLAVNSIQRRGPRGSDCYQGACRDLPAGGAATGS